MIAPLRAVFLGRHNVLGIIATCCVVFCASGTDGHRHSWLEAIDSVRFRLRLAVRFPWVRLFNLGGLPLPR